MTLRLAAMKWIRLSECIDRCPDAPWKSKIVNLEFSGKANFMPAGLGIVQSASRPASPIND